jgi:arginine deiminase
MAWPLPDQEELVHAIAKSTNASFFDLISAFDQTRIDPKDEQYATVINHMGILQQRVIQQGDKNAVATQQRQMQHTLRKHWGKNVVVYIDDGTIFDEDSGMSPYQHFRVCRDILLTLRAAKFYFIPQEDSVLRRHGQ